VNDGLVVDGSELASFKQLIARSIEAGSHLEPRVSLRRDILCKSLLCESLGTSLARLHRLQARVSYLTARGGESSLLGRRIGRDGRKTKDPDIMANIDHKHGTYSILANASQQYTFLRGRDSKAPNEFFDVSIAPHLDKNRS
jgi:hypothetical protein